MRFTTLSRLVVPVAALTALWAVPLLRLPLRSHR